MAHLSRTDFLSTFWVFASLTILGHFAFAPLHADVFIDFQACLHIMARLLDGPWLPLWLLPTLCSWRVGDVGWNWLGDMGCWGKEAIFPGRTEWDGGMAYGMDG